jgi:16S rRNA (uracil1498-N3)-methyltransferase
MARFFINTSLTLDSEYELPAEVVRHILVLRIRPSDPITLFNGNGNDYRATFIKLEKRCAQVKIIAQHPADTESELKITLLMSIIANDKLDMVIQKAVELGCSKFIPVYSKNTQRFNQDKVLQKLEHWRNIIISASEQCGRAKLMELTTPVEFNEAVISCSNIRLKYILSPQHLGVVEVKQDANVTEVVALIGPEGGFANEEVSLALDNQFQAINLGTRILRAETAAISAISSLQAIYGDFNYL